MDLGCHGIAFRYWFLGCPAIKSVYCHMGTFVHADKTQGDDESLCILNFADGSVGLVENSWARRGGMDDRIEVYQGKAAGDWRKMDSSSWKVFVLAMPRLATAEGLTCPLTWGQQKNPSTYGSWAKWEKDQDRKRHV